MNNKREYKKHKIKYANNQAITIIFTLFGATF